MTCKQTDLRHLRKIRIISGAWRGRKLNVSNTPMLRPTTDFMRETVFNWLHTKISGACCLDLFSGSGGLGFEALSRGASKAVMLDSNPHLVTLLEYHAKMFNSQNHEIICTDALRWLEHANGGFDVIFLDPPFASGYIEQCCSVIHQRALLNEQGLVYIEMQRDERLPEGWQIIKQKNHGMVSAALLERVN